MNKTIQYATYALIAAAALGATVKADIGVNAYPTRSGINGQSNCDILASNTVRATYQGQRDLSVQSINDDSPTTARVAIFEVVENLAYKKYERYGDGRLLPGVKFTVSMNREMPGQAASVADQIQTMQPGDEAVMKIDHLYLFGEPEGQALRPCTRIALRKAQTPPPAGENRLPDTVGALDTIPGMAVLEGGSSEFTQTVINNGQVTTVRVVTKSIPGNPTPETHMFINGVEVDPATKQPLSAPSSAAAQPAPAPSSAEPPTVASPASSPSDTGKQGEADNDTVVETPLPSEPGSVQAPPSTAPAAPLTAPKIDAKDSF